MGIGGLGGQAQLSRHHDHLTLTPLDFAFWGFLKAQMYAVKIQDLRHLRQRITDCCATVDPNMLSKIRTRSG
jgi:hypothetical protein